MLPPLNDFGYLPGGIHPCNLDELIAKFGSGSPEREVETVELRDFIDWARRAGIMRLIVNGSYITDKLAPNDVDVVALPGPDYPRDEISYSEQEGRWPFLQVFVAIDETDLDSWSLQDFGTDRNQRIKGVVEVLL